MHAPHPIIKYLILIFVNDKEFKKPIYKQMEGFFNSFEKQIFAHKNLNQIQDEALRRL